MPEGKTVFYYENNEAFEQLADGEQPIFDSRLRFLIFAASVGYAHNRSVDAPDTDNAMRWSYIEGDRSLSVVTAALAYGATDDPNAILDPDQQIEVLQQYGAGGARIIKREVTNEPGDKLDNLVNFLQDHYKRSDTKERVGVLEEIEQEFSSLGQD